MKGPESNSGTPWIKSRAEKREGETGAILALGDGKSEHIRKGGIPVSRAEYI
jgi:hypothetical protein